MVTLLPWVSQLVIDEDTIYFTGGGGSTSVLANIAGASVRLAADDTSIYWSDYEALTINATPKRGGASEVLATLERGPWAIANDACWVYFTVFERGIFRVAK
ncbi:hypothetical protein BH09MYX1_BH09MYX1_23390 [soil metagenome]